METTLVPWENTTTDETSFISTSDIVSRVTTSSSETSMDSAQGAETWLTYVSYVTVPLLLVAGICGNSLTIMVTTGRHYRRSSHSLYLTAMAVADIMFLLAYTLTKTQIHDLFGLDIRSVTIPGCKFFYFFYRATRTVSSSLVVLIAIERFIVVWFPLRAKLLSTRRAAMTAIICVIVGCSIISGVRTLTVNVKNEKCLPVVMTPYNKRIKEVCSAVGMTLRTIIPAVTLLLLTPLIVVKLFHQRYLRRKMSNINHPDETYHVTLMLVSVIIAFYILIMPFCIGKHLLLYANINIVSSSLTWARNMNELQQICEQINCVINFLLYVMVSASFRQHFYAIIRCQKGNEKFGLKSKESATLSTSASTRSG